MPPPFAPWPILAGQPLAHRVKVVVYTAEGLDAASPVVGEYGARDAGILAYTFAPSKSGPVVLTDLNNFVQPRLRYALGDWATRGDG